MTDFVMNLLFIFLCVVTIGVAWRALKDLVHEFQVYYVIRQAEQIIDSHPRRE